MSWGQTVCAQRCHLPTQPAMANQVQPEPPQFPSRLCFSCLCSSAGLSADDRGGFKTARQLLEPVIEQMHEGADDVIKAVRLGPRPAAGLACGCFGVHFLGGGEGGDA